MGSIPGFGRSPEEGNGNPLQYSCQGTEEPGGLQSMGSQRVRHDWVTTKGQRWTARWGTVQGKVWKGPKCQNFCPHVVGVCHHWLYPPIWKLLLPHTIGNFMEVLSFRWDQLLFPFPAPLPSLENEGWCWKFQASNHSLFFLGTSLCPGVHPESLPH